MKKINIRESLLQMDMDTNCRYDLVSLYEVINLDEEKKKELVQYIDAYEDPATIGKFLETNGMPGMMENVSDDLSDEELAKINPDIVAKVSENLCNEENPDDCFESFVHMTDDSNFNPLVRGQHLEVGDKVYADNGDILEVTYIKSDDPWYDVITFLNTNTNEEITNQVGINALFEVVVDGDTTYEVDDIDEGLLGPIGDVISSVKSNVMGESVEDCDSIISEVIKALKLSNSDAEMLQHDINNLRADEWLDDIESINPELANKFKKCFIEDMDEGLLGAAASLGKSIMSNVMGEDIDDYDDNELSNIYGGDRNYCPECGSSNYHDGRCYDCEPFDEENESLKESYSPELLNDLINQYMYNDLEDVWDSVMQEYNNEDLANDVVAGIEEVNTEDEDYYSFYNESLNEDVFAEWKPDTSFKHIKDIYNKVKANDYKFVNNEREEFTAAVKKANDKGYKPEQSRQIKDWSLDIWKHNKNQSIKEDVNKEYYKVTYNSGNDIYSQTIYKAESEKDAEDKFKLTHKQEIVSIDKITDKEVTALKRKGMSIKEDARENTNKVIELAEEGVLSWEDIAIAALKYMSEYDVKDMADANEWFFELEEKLKEDFENGYIAGNTKDPDYRTIREILNELKTMQRRLFSVEEDWYDEKAYNKALDHIDAAYKLINNSLKKYHLVKNESLDETNDVKISKLNDITFVMDNYIKDRYDVNKINDTTYEVMNGTAKALVEFDIDWPEWVYTINGEGPYSHSSYEYLISDLRGYFYSLSESLEEGFAEIKNKIENGKIYNKHEYELFNKDSTKLINYLTDIGYTDKYDPDSDTHVFTKGEDKLIVSDNYLITESLKEDIDNLFTCTCIFDFIDNDNIADDYYIKLEGIVEDCCEQFNLDFIGYEIYSADYSNDNRFKDSIVSKCHFDAEGTDEYYDEDSIKEFIEDSLAQIGSELVGIEFWTGAEIKESVDTGKEYWYFTKHGVQPGSVPKGVNILDIKDTENGSYFLTDKMLTTDELNEYEIKEQIPEDVDESLKEDIEIPNYLFDARKELLNSEYINSVKIFSDENAKKYDEKYYVLIDSTKGKLKGYFPSMSQINLYDEAGNELESHIFIRHIDDEFFIKGEGYEPIYKVYGGEFEGTYEPEEFNKLPLNGKSLEGYAGPFKDGFDNHRPVIRYETWDMYDQLSR